MIKMEQKRRISGGNGRDTKNVKGKAIIGISMAAIMIVSVLAATMPMVSASSDRGNFNIIKPNTTEKVLLGQNLQFEGFTGTVIIVRIVSGDIENVYQPDANNRIYNVNWPTSGAYYVAYNTADQAQLSVKEPNMPLQLKVGTKEVSSLAAGTSVTIYTGGMNLFPGDQVDLVVIGPDGQIEHDEVNDQQFTDITVKELNDKYGYNNLETTGWTIGAYTFKVKTDDAQACGLKAESVVRPLAVLKGEIAIEADMTSTVKLETVKLIVTGVAGDEINVAASPLSDDVVFKAGIDDTPTNAGCEFEDKIDSDGIRKYAVEFNNKGIYRIKVTVIDGPRKGDSDTEDITVSEKEMPLDLPAPIPSEGGLVGYWNFNEGSGNIAYDSSGSGNDGTIHGATFVSGISGQALSFDGKDDYVSAPVDINPTVMPQMTITAWVRADDDSGGTIVSHDNGGFDRTIDIDTRGGGKGWSVFSGSWVVGYSPVTIGEWFFLAAVYDQSAETVKLYVNGALISEEKGKLGSGWDYINIGKNPSFGDYFSGTVDEVMIYNYALSADEINALYDKKEPSAPTTTPPPIDSEKAPVTVLTSSTILPTAGGLLTVESEDNELNGASLDVPAQAVTNNVTISIATTENLPSGSPFGQVPVGKLFVLLPSNLTFSEPVTITLPIPAGEDRYNLYIGRWDDKNKIWENIGGTIDGDFIATNISHLSFYGLFYTGKSTVEIVNRQQLDTSDLPITVMYIAGPVPPPDTPDQSQFRATRPLPAGGVQLKQDESRIMQLLPGRYHFLVSYPRPQPGVANSMWFTIPVLTGGADDGQIDQTIAIRDYGADSTNTYTNDSIMFPGRTVVESTNFRPVVNCNAIVPEGVPLLGTNQILNIGPIKIEQLQDEGITLSAAVRDPEGSALKYYWTVPTGASISSFTSGTMASGSTLGTRFKTRRAGIYTVYFTVYDQYGLFNEGRWIIRAIPNAKPYIDVVVDDRVIDFGRLDGKRRNYSVYSAVPAPGLPRPSLPRNHSIPFPNVNFLPTPGIPNWGVYVTPPVPGEISASTELKRLATLPDPAHVDPTQYPGGMTCVYAIVADADGDAIDAEFVLSTPLFGRGNMYTAIPIPNRTNPITSEIRLSDGKTLAESFPDGYRIGAMLYNYKVMEAYNAVLTEYANRGWLPLQPHVRTNTPLLVAPTGPRRYTVPDIETDLTIVFTTPVRGEFPYVIAFDQAGIMNGSIKPDDIVTEAPNPLNLTPNGKVYKVIVVEGSWTNGDAKGYLWMIPVTDDFWDPRHSHLVPPTLLVNGVPKATCSYVGQTLPVIWEAPDDPDVEQTTHDRRHLSDPDTIISKGGTVNIEARVNDPFSPQERAFGLVAWPTPAWPTPAGPTPTPTSTGDPPGTETAKWILVETRVNPDNAPTEFIGGGATPGYYTSPRANGTLEQFTVSEGRFIYRTKKVDYGYEYYDATFTASFDKPPSTLIPGKNITLTATASGSGTVSERAGGCNAVILFEYRADGVNLQGDTQAGLCLEFKTDTATSWFIVPPARNKGEIRIKAFLWNHSPCCVEWVYSAY
ncbi:hypothetical protein C5S29_06990 [ANME-1 cluster archaeon GoMg3.2]|nr:hypothetical protein [ANME-1 cluster archaeon GoMg3.2]